ncbi:MAG: SpoIIE family protein phosphatase, partial [Planctomycetes bacterium]|nr:SpoIIE family protein phosphatase [Planctomycetota bacterium]
NEDTDGDDPLGAGQPQRRDPRSAESTHFRAQPVGADMRSVNAEPVRPSDTFHTGGKSLRLGVKAGQGGLAMKVALPVTFCLIIGLAISFLVIHDRLNQQRIAAFKNEAADEAYSMGVLGRLLLAHKNLFLKENPNYETAVEWPAGEHWLVAHGFVDAGDWISATGFGLNEYAPVEVLDKAAERLTLLDFQRWLNTPGGATNLVGVFILDTNGVTIASAVSSTFRFDPVRLRLRPVSEDHSSVGLHRIMVDYLPDFEPEPVVRGVARIMSGPESGLQIGSAVVVLKTSTMEHANHSFIVLLLTLMALLTIFMIAITWLSARRAIVPIRRLVADMQAMAEGDYARRSALAASSDETGQLALAFNSMAERLRVARVNEKENSRLESDLAIARNIQNNLLPPQTPRVRGLDIHTTYRPAREIGGDYYDFLPVDNQHIGVVIADASGKSIPAALVMSTTRAILRFVAPGNLSAAETLTRVNAILSADIPQGMFVTACYTVLDPLTKSMICASAGHTPLLIAREDGSIEQLNPGGIALGFDSGPIFQRSIREQRVNLNKGDRVLMYTDGVVECVNPANEEYSDRRLREFLRRHRDLSSFEFVGALMADLDRYRGAAEIRDDTTVVTFKVL